MTLGEKPDWSEKRLDWSDTVDEWQAYGLTCRTRPGFGCFNGYVQVPTHLTTNEAAERTFDAHWGITWGPDADGWVGFDTGHAGDWWAPDDLIGHFPDTMIRFANDMREMSSRTTYSTQWTHAKLRAHTEQLAQQLAIALDLATPDEGAPFTCPRCSAVSHHPDDRTYGYCAACRDFTAPGIPPKVDLTKHR